MYVQHILNALLIHKGAVMNEAKNVNTDKVAPAVSLPATEQATNLSQQVFSNPRDFLKTIQDNFKEMSHGHERISLSDLKDDVTSGSTDKVRAAAAIAVQHYSDLDRMEDPAFDKPGIEKTDIDFAVNMNDHNISSEAWDRGSMAAGATVSSLFAGGVSLLLASDSLTGVGVFGAAGGVVLPAVTIGAGLASVAVGAYAAYKTATAYSSLKQESNVDAAKFKSWV
jgi:hypothetical protein